MSGLGGGNCQDQLFYYSCTEQNLFCNFLVKVRAGGHIFYLNSIKNIKYKGTGKLYIITVIYLRFSKLTTKV